MVMLTTPGLCLLYLVAASYLLILGLRVVDIILSWLHLRLSFADHSFTVEPLRFDFVVLVRICLQEVFSLCGESPAIRQVYPFLLGLRLDVTTAVMLNVWQIHHPSFRNIRALTPVGVNQIKKATKRPHLAPAPGSLLKFFSSLLIPFLYFARYSPDLFLEPLDLLFLQLGHLVIKCQNLMEELVDLIINLTH